MPVHRRWRVLTKGQGAELGDELVDPPGPGTVALAPLEFIAGRNRIIGAALDPALREVVSP